VRVCKDGCKTDHLPIKIEANIKSRRLEVNSIGPNTKKDTRLKIKINADLLKVNVKRLTFQSIISEVITHKPNYYIITSNIVTAAKEVAAEEVRPKPDWFEQKKEELAHQITVRNDAHYDFIKRSSHRNQVRLQDDCRLLKRTKRRAKIEWQRELEKVCTNEAFTDNPKRCGKFSKT
jgi:hypothetical protein